MPEWRSDAVPVLNRLREVSLPTVQWQKPTAQEQAAINKVWTFVGVQIGEYGSSENPWTGVKGLQRRKKVRQELHKVFIDDTAFLPGGRAARDAFTRDHLLDCGDRLLAADAAAAAANAAGPTVTDDDSTGLDTAISVVLAKLPEETRLIVEGIMEEAAAKGYEISDWDELVRYARTRYVEAAAEFGAVDSVLAPALPDAAQPGPFDDDLSELYENVSRSRSGRDGASVISDFSLSSRLSGLSFVSQREALLRLHRDMIDNRVSVDTIPGLKKTRSKLQKAVRKIRKAGTRLVKKVQNSLPGKR